MDLSLVEKIVNAVLYEGYMLYPYRASALKNRQRWTFGGVYPQAYSLARGGAEPWRVQTECLVVGGQGALLELKVRFLQLLSREVGVLPAPLLVWPEDREPAFRVVEALELGEQRYHTWQEAVEREVCAGPLALGELLAQPLRLEFAFPARRELEPLRGPDGAIVGLVVRHQQPLAGAVELVAEQVGEQLYKLRVQVRNLTPWQESEDHAREPALLGSFASTHSMLALHDGAFVSLIDPPEPLRELAASCENVGLWPVLVGEPGAQDMLLAAPIILYDYPQVAPESPGDLFDGTEIDELLTLCIMAMTEEEKREMGAVDARARALLQRTETLSDEALLRLHGTVRGLRPLGGSG